MLTPRVQRPYTPKAPFASISSAPVAKTRQVPPQAGASASIRRPAVQRPPIQGRASVAVKPATVSASVLARRAVSTAPQSTADRDGSSLSDVNVSNSPTSQKPVQQLRTPTLSSLGTPHRPIPSAPKATNPHPVGAALSSPSTNRSSPLASTRAPPTPARPETTRRSHNPPNLAPPPPLGLAAASIRARLPDTQKHGTSHRSFASDTKQSAGGRHIASNVSASNSSFCSVSHRSAGRRLPSDRTHHDEISSSRRDRQHRDEQSCNRSSRPVHQHPDNESDGRSAGVHLSGSRRSKARDKGRASVDRSSKGESSCGIPSAPRLATEEIEEIDTRVVLQNQAVMRAGSRAVTPHLDDPTVPITRLALRILQDSLTGSPDMVTWLIAHRSIQIQMYPKGEEQGGAYHNTVGRLLQQARGAKAQPALAWRDPKQSDGKLSSRADSHRPSAGSKDLERAKDRRGEKRRRERGHEKDSGKQRERSEHRDREKRKEERVREKRGHEREGEKRGGKQRETEKGTHSSRREYTAEGCSESLRSVNEKINGRQHCQKIRKGLSGDVSSTVPTSPCDADAIPLRKFHREGDPSKYSQNSISPRQTPRSEVQPAGPTTPSPPPLTPASACRRDRVLSVDSATVAPLQEVAKARGDSELSPAALDALRVPPTLFNAVPLGQLGCETGSLLTPPSIKPLADPDCFVGDMLDDDVTGPDMASPAAPNFIYDNMSEGLFLSDLNDGPLGTVCEGDEGEETSTGSIADHRRSIATKARGIAAPTAPHVAEAILRQECSGEAYGIRRKINFVPLDLPAEFTNSYTVLVECFSVSRDEDDLNQSGKQLADRQQPVQRAIQAIRLCASPQVHIFPNFLTADECEALLDAARGRWKLSDHRNRSLGASSKLRPGSTEGPSFALMDSECEAAVVDLIERRAAQVADATLDRVEPLRVMRYTPGQQVGPHHDGSFRSVTMYVFLNDLDAGGDIHFVHLGIKIPPNRGMAVIWPNVHITPSEVHVDLRVVHSILPPERTVKYSLTAFITTPPSLLQQQEQPSAN